MLTRKPPKPREVAKVLRSYSKPFPDDPEQRLASILSCVNSETKSILLAFCLDENPRTTHDIRKLFGHVTGDIWTPDYNVLRENCRRTLIPIGSVAEETVVFKTGCGRKKSGSSAWVTTESGERYAQPIAVFTLKYAVEANNSIYTILGSTNSGAPYSRVRYLEELRAAELSGKSLRRADLSNISNKKCSRVVSHLKALEKLGFLVYESVSPWDSGWGQYKWIEEKDLNEVKPVDGCAELTRLVSEKLQELGDTSGRELAKLLGKARTTISNILSGLEKQGFAEAPVYKTGSKLSDAVILQPGIDFLEGYSDKVRNALADGEELKMMQELYKEFEANYAKRLELAHAGMELYEQTSPLRNAKTREENAELIINFVKGYPDKRGPKHREMIKNYGTGINRHLRYLIESGQLIKEKTGSEVHYRLKKIS